MEKDLGLIIGLGNVNKGVLNFNRSIVFLDVVNGV